MQGNHAKMAPSWNPLRANIARIIIFLSSLNSLSVAGRGLPMLADSSFLRRYPCQRVDISGHSDLPHARIRKEQLLWK